MRQFLIALVVVWTAACIGAYFYSQQIGVRSAVTGAILPALLIELGLYLLPGFPNARTWFDTIPSKMVRALLLGASAVIPYLLVSNALRTFSFTSFVLLAALAAGASFWYAVVKRGPVVDLLFLAFMAAVFASRAFDWIYPRLTPRVSLDILGRLMWIRLGLLAVLSMRRLENVRFGFVPSAREWKVGFQLYLFFLPIGALVAFGLGFVHFQLLALPWWKYITVAVGTFLGFLWVVALAEEFFFRGFLQQLLARGLRSQIAGLLIASLLFGVVHLWFRAFPNWRFAVLASITGVFYGLAFMRTGSVRASMVTHALVVSTWRLFFVS